MREKFESPEASAASRPQRLPCKDIIRPSQGALCDGDCPSNVYSAVKKKVQPTFPGTNNGVSVSNRDPEVPDKVWKRNVKTVGSSVVSEAAKNYETAYLSISSGGPKYARPTVSARHGATMSERKPGKPPPPLKPPRTFMHDIYARDKVASSSYGCVRKSAPASSSPNRTPPKCGARPPRANGLVDHEYDEVAGDCSRPFVDLTQTTTRPARSVTNLRRSFSDEHIYAEPEALRRDVSTSRLGTGSKELHYMSSPIRGLGGDGQPSAGLKVDSNRIRAFTSQVRDAIHHSFTSAKKHLQGAAAKSDDQTDPQGDSSSEVSVKEVQKRLIYVQSIKKKGYACCPSSGAAMKPQVLQYGFVVGYGRVNASLPLQPEVFYTYPAQLDDSGYDPVIVAHLCLPVPHQSAVAESPERSISYFTLSGQNREITFFHCLYLPNPSEVLGRHRTGPVVLCIATTACAPAFYRKLLSDLEGLLKRLNEPAWTDLLTNLSKQVLPSPGCRLVCQKHSASQGDVTILTERPLDDRFDWVKLTVLLVTLDADILLQIASTLLAEKRLILVCDDTQQLYHWVEAVESLLYPFKWTHTKVPVVPKSLLFQCSSPEPYLLGVPSSLAHTVLDMVNGPVLVVDVDRGTLLSDVEEDRTVLPGKLQRALCTALSLAKNMTDPTERMRDLMITESFVRMFVELVGHCDSHISLLSNGTYSFRRESFMRMPSSRGVQMFLQWFTETQMFDLFLAERAQRVAQLKRTPQHHLLPKGVFERRANEYLLDCERSGKSLKEFSKRMKNFGERLRNLKAFQ